MAVHQREGKTASVKIYHADSGILDEAITPITPSLHSYVSLF